MKQTAKCFWHQGMQEHKTASTTYLLLIRLKDKRLLWKNALLTRILLTSVISNTIGRRLNTKALRTKLIPLVPLSIALDKAPVCLLKWKPKSKLWRWRNTFLAILRIEFWATFPNTAFRTSLKKAAPALDTPSNKTKEKK